MIMLGIYIVLAVTIMVLCIPKLRIIPLPVLWLVFFLSLCHLYIQVFWTGTSFYKNNINEYAQERAALRYGGDYNQLLQDAEQKSPQIWQVFTQLNSSEKGYWTTGRAQELFTVFLNFSEPEALKKASYDASVVKWSDKLLFLSNTGELKRMIGGYDQLIYFISFLLFSLLSFRVLVINDSHCILAIRAAVYFAGLLIGIALNVDTVLFDCLQGRSKIVSISQVMKNTTPEQLTEMLSESGGTPDKTVTLSCFVVSSKYSPAKYCRFRLGKFSYLYFVPETRNVPQPENIMAKINPRITWKSLGNGFWRGTYWDLTLLRLAYHAAVTVFLLLSVLIPVYCLIRHIRVQKTKPLPPSNEGLPPEGTSDTPSPAV